MNPCKIGKGYFSVFNMKAAMIFFKRNVYAKPKKHEKQNLFFGSSG